MKIVIADNEKLIRYTLKSMLEEIKIDSKVVGEAKDGEEMIELIRLHSPDIAFVDIRMPKLNGLDAIKIAKDLSPDTKWVILTSYSEFEYAKKAISLGAYEYLLKPVTPEKLEETLTEIFKIEQENNIILNEKFENEICSLLYNTRSFDEKSKNLFTKSNFFGTVILFDSFLNEKEKAKLQIDFCSSLRRHIEQIITKEIKIALVTMPNGNLATICSWESPNKASDRIENKNISQKYLDRLSDLSKNFTNDKFCITLITTDICPSFSILNQQFDELDTLTRLRLVSGIGNTGSLSELRGLNNCLHPLLINVSSILIELSDAYRERSYLNFMKKLEILENNTQNISLDNIDLDIKKAINCFLKYSINFTGLLLERNKIQVSDLRNHSNTLLINKSADQQESLDIVSRVKNYIEKNYSQDIGIALIAYKLKLTPNYLSYLFHKDTGTTFIKYLKKIRLLKAQELLMNPGSKVNAVAKKVGYYSSQYFTKIFKKEYGCYPSDYRKTQKL